MMSQILEAAFISGLIGAMMRMATPIIFATLGEILAERSGVLNLGIEGIMLMGAMTGFLVSLSTGSLWLGVFMAALVGMALGLLMAFLSVHLGLSQHVSGLGITLFAAGLAMFIYRLHFGSPTVPPTVKPFQQVAIPWLSEMPIIGPGLFKQYTLTYIAWLLVPAISVLLYKTNVGLKIRTVGENPIVADTVGVNVTLTRTLCLVAGGALMGVGGAFLTLAHQNMFLIDVIGGRGWVAIAMVIFRKLGSGEGHAGRADLRLSGRASAQASGLGNQALFPRVPHDPLSSHHCGTGERVQKSLCAGGTAETLSERGERILTGC